MHKSTSGHMSCFNRNAKFLPNPRREIAPQWGHLKTLFETYLPHLAQYAISSHIKFLLVLKIYVCYELLVANLQHFFNNRYPPPVKNC